MRNYRSSNVEVHIGLRLISPEGRPAPVSATLYYAAGDPYAVHMVFHMRRNLTSAHANLDVGASLPITSSPAPSRASEDAAESSEDISWTFSRELLSDGLSTPSGYGDVRIWPWSSSKRRSVALALSSPDGYALFEAPRSVVERFLNRCYSCVPNGLEESHIDIDSSLANLLGAPDADAR